MTEKLKLGYCGICDTTQIWYRDKKTNRLIFTPEYTEFSFVLSDGKVYRHAVCNRCIVKLDDAKLNALLDRIKATWQDEMVGSATDKQFDNVRSLKIKTYGMNHKEMHKEAKIIKEKEREEKIKQAKKEK